MPLEHELLELNGAYQSCLSANSAWRDRCQQLEQLVREYRQLHIDYSMIVYGDIEKLNVWIQKRDTLQQRAKELLG
jgi:hypothetical protein